MSGKSAIGIDLGTSNSAIAITEGEDAPVRVVETTQILGPNRLGERETLASALYVPHPEEFPAGAFSLPWHEASGDLTVSSVAGHFAREHGALVPDRLITSAKSWLSNPHIDPHEAMLPWQSLSVEPRISPLTCSRRYLEELREGMLHALAQHDQALEVEHSQVVLTVPASFDEVARNLTLEAAQQAGWGSPLMLEEPQAAFYAWTEAVGSGWREQVGPGDVILVCDLGGGTADFSLIAIAQQEGQLRLERISVGEHILLGGDNMDLALAYTLRDQMEQAGTTIDEGQFLSLIHNASQAKASLFEDETLAEVPIALPSRGSSLFAKTVSTKLDRELLQGVILDGFFPITAIDEQPEEGDATGLSEFGLPYATDPAVSRHLARFLARSLINVQGNAELAALVGERAASGQALLPSAVLFNGGVFKAAPVRTRVLELLNHWSPNAQVRALEGFQPDLAVAKGAACYGRMRANGKGLRIKAGTARSYYIGLQSSRPAVPGFKPTIKALCVVPQGMEEGSEEVIEGQTFGLVVGKPARFRFFSSEVRSGDRPGEILGNAENTLEETSALEIALPPMQEFPQGATVPVRIESVVNELGVLELWMHHTNSERRWKVEYQVRTS